jgi:hypothetical protein
VSVKSDGLPAAWLLAQKPWIVPFAPTRGAAAFVATFAELFNLLPAIVFSAGLR